MLILYSFPLFLRGEKRKGSSLTSLFCTSFTKLLVPSLHSQFHLTLPYSGEIGEASLFLRPGLFTDESMSCFPIGLCMASGLLDKSSLISLWVEKWAWIWSLFMTMFSSLKRQDVCFCWYVWSALIYTSFPYRFHSALPSSREMRVIGLELFWLCDVADEANGLPLRSKSAFEPKVVDPRQEAPSVINLMFANSVLYYCYSFEMCLTLFQRANNVPKRLTSPGFICII